MNRLQKDFRSLEDAICHFSTHARMREAWMNIRARYRDQKRFERWREKLEIELIARRFSEPSQISGINRNNHRYRWHPVEAVLLIREHPLFSHLNIEEIAAECKRLGSPIGDRDYLSWTPPKTDAYNDMYNLGYRHGLFCRGCSSARAKINFDFLQRECDLYYSFNSEQAQAALCDDCVLAAKKTRELKQQREWIMQRRFQEARAERSRLLAEQRAAQDEEFRKKREAAKAAREMAKIERDAAYKLVKDIGLLDVVRETLREDGHETQTTH